MNSHLTDPAFKFRSKELRGPDPVGAKGMRTLRMLDGGVIAAWWPVSAAPRTYERLRRSGYVRYDNSREYAQITEAGRALLGRLWR